MVKTVLRLSVLILALFAVAGLAAEKPGPLPASKPGRQQALPQEAILDDPLGRSTPEGTVLGFMKAVGRDDYERAVEYLDTKQPPKRAQELTRELELILNRGLSANLTRLSKKPEGILDDTLRPNREKIGVVKTESGIYDILLDRVQREMIPRSGSSRPKPSDRFLRSTRSSVTTGQKRTSPHCSAGPRSSGSRCGAGLHSSWASRSRS